MTSDLDKVLNAEPGSSAAPSVARFSKGPWNAIPSLGYDHWYVVTPAGPAAPSDIVVYGPQSEANAHLVAAAPDLYWALAVLLEELDKDPTGLAALYAMNGAKAALAKASPPTDAGSERTTSNTDSSQKILGSNK